MASCTALGRGPSSDCHRLDRLALGELGQQRILLGREIGVVAHGREEGRDDLGIEHRSAGRHVADGAGQAAPIRHAVLEQIGVTRGTIAQQRYRIVRFVVLREHHDACAWIALADELGGLDALVLEGRRHADVGHHDLGPGGVGRGQQLVEVGRHADDLEVRLEAEQRPRPLPHQHVVVRKKHRDLRAVPVHVFIDGRSDRIRQGSALGD